jgi:hypothetical protein
MTISLLASAKAAALNGTTTAAIDTTGAKLLLASFAYNNGVSLTFSDSAGNTWTALTTSTNGSTRSTRQYYCINPTTSASHTFTFGGTSITGSITVTAWGATSIAFDKEVGGHASGSAITVAGGTASVTPANNNSLLITTYGFGAFTSSAAASGAWVIAQDQAGAGGTNFGNGQIYLLQTTAATIASATFIATSALGENTDRTAVFYEPPAESLTITTPKAFEVHQRSGSTGTIQISGTVAGATEDIEASFNGGAYVTIAAAVAAGSFSGTLTGQAQGQGTLTVRKKTTTSTSSTVANVGIGDVFVVGGDSISEGRGTNAQSYTHATLKAAKFTQADAWGEGNDGIDTGTTSGSHWPLLATQIMADQGVPVAFISVGTGSTDVAGSANSWAKPGGEYTGLTSQVTDSTVLTVKGVLMHLGPNAVVNASTLSLATYNAALDTLASNLATDVAGAPKLNIGIFGEVSTGSPPDRVSALNNLRGAIIQALGDNANVKPGPCLIDLNYSDGVHPQSDADLQAVAARWWLALSETYYGGSGGRGPRLSLASWNAGRNQLTVEFDRALKTGLTHATACWAVSDNGSAMTVSSIAYHGSNPNALVLTMSAAAVGAANTTTLTFANGDTAVGVVVPRSTDITMPVGAVVTIPAEPIYAAAVSEVDVTAPTLTSPSATATGQTTATGSVTTNEGNGTLYRYASTNASETAATIKAAALTQAVSGTGVQAVSFTGLTAGTTYYPHYVHRDAAGNDSAASSGASFTTTAPTATTVTLTLTTDGSTPAASLTGLKWAFFDQVSPGSFVAPTAKGTVETTDGSGVLVLSITGTALTVGGTGWLIVTDSDGTTTQSPAAKAFSGPVVVA